jgi:hypothetical protein
LKTQIACGGRLYKKLNGLIFEVKLKGRSLLMAGSGTEDNFFFLVKNLLIRPSNGEKNVEKINTHTWPKALQKDIPFSCHTCFLTWV